MPGDALEATARAFRSEYSRTLAIVLRVLGGDLAAAEDAVQDAFAAAADSWTSHGVPPNPQAWIVRTARNKALDRLRADGRARQREQALRAALGSPPSSDDELHLIFLCCSPALTAEAQITLALKLLAGLTTREIARAFHVPEATIAQRLSRAKARLRTSGDRIAQGPPELEAVLPSVLAVVYLMFNEGYTATAGTDLSRPDLAGEAVRLSGELLRLMPREPEVMGLRALLLFLHARRDARVDPGGRLVTLPNQDRHRWYHDELEDARALLRRCLVLNRPGSYQLQAAIQAVHTEPRDNPDWSQIVQLYDQLLTIAPTAIARLNRAVALAHTDGPDAALASIEELPDEQQVLAVRAFLHAAAHRPLEAQKLYQQAATIANNSAERDHLLQQAQAATRNRNQAGSV